MSKTIHSSLPPAMAMFTKIPVGFGFIMTVAFVLLAVLGVGGSTTTAEAASQPIDVDLALGDRGESVTRLQAALAAYPELYPQGLITGYFGSLTAAAVTNFQKMQGIAQVGRFGPLTRARFNSLAAVDASLVTGALADLNAPVLYTPSVASVASTNATIHFAADGPSRGKVFYDTRPLAMTEASADFIEPYVSGMVAQDLNYQNAHDVMLTNLAPGTTYYYSVLVADQFGNVSLVPMRTFTTSY